MGIFNGIARFLVGGKAKSKTTGTSNTTTTAAPYAPVQPSLEGYIGKVNDVFNNTPQISPLEQQGYGAVQAAAATGGVQPAIDANNRTISGEYLTPETNPYLADIAKRVGGGAMASINTTFGGHGRTGSGLHAQLGAQGVGDALTDLYGQQYNAERGRQQQAIAAAPQLDAARYLAPQALISAGQNVSARPFDVATQQGGILANLARLGGTTTSNGATTGTSVGQAEANGMIQKIATSFTNKLFGMQ